MKKMRPALIALAVLAGIASCSSEKPPLNSTHAAPTPTPTPAAATPANTDTRAPVVVSLRGPAAPKAGDDIELSVVIERTSTAFNPMNLVITLPPNAQLTQGSISETIDDSGATKWVRPLTLHLTALPTTDLTATVDVQQQGFGVHATAAYRFGRAAPRLPDVETDEARRVNGFDLGRAVPLGRKATPTPDPASPVGPPDLH